MRGAPVAPAPASARAAGAKRPRRSPPPDAPDDADPALRAPPDLPDEILSSIVTSVARAPDGGMPSVLAVGGTCRSWSRAARAPELWRDMARKRFGFSHDIGHGFGLLPGCLLYTSDAADE